MKNIYLAERNIHGAIVIYGDLGVKQYYYYTKRQAIQLYKAECEQKIITKKCKRSKYGLL